MDERCEACPIHVLAAAVADAVAARLCPKERAMDETLISPDQAAAKLGKSRSWLDRRRRKLPWSAAIRAHEKRGYSVVSSRLEQIIRDGA